MAGKKRKTFQPPSSGVITNTLAGMFTPTQATFELTDNALGATPAHTQMTRMSASDTMLRRLSGCSAPAPRLCARGP